jgi:cob(I)alamin adenosyltransferase
VAIRITRVYTRRGDRGETDLVGGARVPKDHARIDAYGTVDELNAALGVVRAFNATERGRQPGQVRVRRELDAVLRKLQSELFDLGAELATPPASFVQGMFRVGDAEVTALEMVMDRCQRELEPLRSFVLPGGGRTSALLHVARTVCRRAERDVLRLMRVDEVGAGPLRYLNRLSDLLFVLSRWIGHHAGEREFLWERPIEREAALRAAREGAARPARETPRRKKVAAHTVARKRR